MPSPQREEWATAEDYWNLPAGRRAELVDGKLYDMAPPSWIHQRVVVGISHALAGYIVQHGGDCKVSVAPTAVNLDGDESTWVEPDIMVACDPAKISDRGCEGAPDWIAEVVSPSNRRWDYRDKRIRYERAGVREYWIVDLEAEQTTVYRFGQKPEVAAYPFPWPVPVGLFEGLSIRVGDFV